MTFWASSIKKPGSLQKIPPDIPGRPNKEDKSGETRTDDSPNCIQTCYIITEKSNNNVRTQSILKSDSMLMCLTKSFILHFRLIVLRDIIFYQIVLLYLTNFSSFSRAIDANTDWLVFYQHLKQSRIEIGLRAWKCQLSRNRVIDETDINQVEWRDTGLSAFTSTLRFCPTEIPEVLSHTPVSDQGLDSVGGTGMDCWPRGCRWIRTNWERVGFLSVCSLGFLLLPFALSALLLPRLARKVIGRLFASLSGTKWAALPVDCCYLSSDKET